MDCSDQKTNSKTTSAAQIYSLSPSSSPTGSPSSAPPVQVIVSPCAACKTLRRRCVEKCVFAPYFPPTEPLKFTIAHKVFGASNIMKLLQELPEANRADAVNSLVYEANARIRDPVYGCAGAICLLQKQISELQAELAKAQAEILNMQCQNENLIFIRMEMLQQHHDQDFTTHELQPCENTIASSFFFDESNNILGAAWEPLWA